MNHQGFGDFHHLALCHAEGFYLGSRIGIQTDFLQMVASLFDHGAIIDYAPHFARLPRHEQVFRHAQIRDQIQFLMNDADSHILRVLGIPRYEGLALV